MNYEMKASVTVLGNASIQGNAFFRSALKAMQDITIQSETCNAQNAVLYSQYGDITINGTYISLNGLIYAPFGEVRIRANNLNLNQIVIIAEKITLEGLCINANYSQETGAFVDIPSEEFTIPEEDEDYLKDSDEDGLWDAMEREIGSDPYNVDTDGDGLLDGEEIDPELCYADYGSRRSLGVATRSATTMSYFGSGGDPRYGDSDGDGDSYNDYEEVTKYKSNPYKNEVKKIGWNKKFIAIDYKGKRKDLNEKVSYGGSQRWFYEKGEEWYSWFSYDYTLMSYGCGLVSGSDVLLYLAQRNKKYVTKRTKAVKKNKTGNLNQTSYMRYLNDMNGLYFTVLPGLGVLGPSLALDINWYSSDYKLGLQSKWCISKKKLLSRIKKMLKMNIPVTMSIGPCKGKKRKKGIKFYGWTSKKNDNYIFNSIKEEKVSGHYFTVTGMLINGVKHETILEISSWGMKYYVNYKEYQNTVDEQSSYKLSNIVYIERK